MPKTPKNNSKAKRSYRRRSRKNKKPGRVFAFTLGFILVLILSLYGAYYAKHNLFSETAPGGLPASQISGLTKDADGIIAGAFFDMGISLEDIHSKKVYKKEKEGVEWEYRDIKVSVPPGVTEKRVKSIILESFSGKPAYKQEFKSSGNSLTADIKINDLGTHRIKFEFPIEKAAPGKIVKKKTETPERQAPDKKAFDKGMSTGADQFKAKPDGGVYKPRVVIIVDDVGLNKRQIDKLLELPAPVTFAVLPDLPYSDYAAEMAQKKDWDVMLHLPMEPKESSGYIAADAGEEVLLVGLPKKDILIKLDKMLSSVPHIKGVNNHMGSKFMENEELVELVLRDINAKGLFFVDSLTSGGSAGYETALNLGMQTAKRDVFLDDASKGSAYVKSQINKLVEISERKGYAIGICHPYPDTVSALSEMIPLIRDKVELTTVSSVLNRPREVSER